MDTLLKKIIGKIKILQKKTHIRVARTFPNYHFILKYMFMDHPRPHTILIQKSIFTDIFKGQYSGMNALLIFAVKICLIHTVKVAVK